MWPKNQFCSEFRAIALFLVMAIAVLSPCVGQAQDKASNEEVNPISVPNMGADLWRTVRGRSDTPAVTQIPGMDASVLINPLGDSWQKLRAGPVRYYIGWALLGVFALLLAIFLIRGQVKIEQGRSGVMVERWKRWDRLLHWYTAVLFIILTISGLSLLFGRTLLIPMIGQEAFGAWAIASKVLHNYLGPFFTLGVLVMILTQLRHNIPNFVDLKWFLQGGGMIGSKHPDAGRVNGGEKLFVYWVMASVGVAVCVTGVILDFPNLVEEATRETMQRANIIHAIASAVWIFFVCGHIYLGSVGVEGVLEGMWRGKVDANWAQQHHNLWYRETQQQAEEAQTREGANQTKMRDAASSTT